ncbi:MAG TPA: copper chaperone PCu(A)C [Modicisalibacter sp.]|nr:copper chaperone PCu(A)C [Modicisalibacter sp.]
MSRLLALPLLAVLFIAPVTALLVAPAAQAHEINQDGVRITHPFATPTPPGAPNGGAYLDISAEGDAISLVGASSPISKAVEIHSMSMDNGTMQMRRLESLDVPPGVTVKMRPGESGAHFMLIGLEEALEVGDKFSLTLEFANRDSLEVEVWVQPAGEGSAAADGHHH